MGSVDPAAGWKVSLGTSEVGVKNRLVIASGDNVGESSSASQAARLSRTRSIRTWVTPVTKSSEARLGPQNAVAIDMSDTSAMLHGIIDEGQTYHSAKPCLTS